jgi:ABC-type amino acid transport system permease subunit
MNSVAIAAITLTVSLVSGASTVALVSRIPMRRAGVPVQLSFEGEVCFFVAGALLALVVQLALFHVNGTNYRRMSVRAMVAVVICTPFLVIALTVMFFFSMPLEMFDYLTDPL